jgi:hypothetical protein
MVSDSYSGINLDGDYKLFLAGEKRGKKKGNTTSLDCIASAKNKWSSHKCIFLS